MRIVAVGFRELLDFEEALCEVIGRLFDPAQVKKGSFSRLEIEFQKIGNERVRIWMLGFRNGVEEPTFKNNETCLRGPDGVSWEYLGSLFGLRLVQRLLPDWKLEKFPAREIEKKRDPNYYSHDFIPILSLCRVARQ